MLEHEYEPVPGLPGHLPAGEVLLWQGAPQWKSMARHALHQRKFIAYFAVLLTWYAVSTYASEGIWDAAIGTLRFGAMAVLVIALLDVFAWLVARTTRYTITSRRVVMRFGIALPITINLPFKMVESASLKANADGTGDLLLTLLPSESVSYMLLWPHVRPWHIVRPKPLLRALPDVARAGAVLGRALAMAHGQPVPVVAGVAGERNPAAEGAVTA